MTDSLATNSPPTWANEGIGRVAAPLRDQVLNIVRQAILNFDLKPGDRLIERELVEWLQVSRTTIRDVLARLSIEGLVTNIPQKGMIVTVITMEEAKDIYEMRASLEPLAVRCFVHRASAVDLTRLRAALDHVVAVASTTSVDNGTHVATDGLRAKDSFYEVLLAGAQSPRLSQVLTILQGQVRALRVLSLSDDGRPREAAEELRVVVDAIEAGDADAAAEACALHIRNAARIGLIRLGSLAVDNG